MSREKKEKAPKMTKVKYSCGHEQEINLTGSKMVRQKKMERKMLKSICHDCYKAKEGSVAAVVAGDKI